MASWKQQALIDAPVDSVWELIVDPARFSEWNGETVEVTGLPTHVEKGTTFEMKSKGPLGTSTTTFKVEELSEDLHEVKLRCQLSGYYSHWVLTEARGQTFADMELGVEPPSVPANAFRLVHNKRYLRRVAEQSLDGLRRAVSRS